MCDPQDDRLRFQVELEFVQCLGNPNYLNFLAQRGYFKDQAFINYLKYLLYWKEPQYACYLKYPMCLYFLDQLQYEPFRRELSNAQCAKFIDDQQMLLWQHYTKKRTRLLTEPTDSAGNTPTNGGSGSSSSTTTSSTSTSSSSNGSSSSSSGTCSCSSGNGNNGNGNGSDSANIGVGNGNAAIIRPPQNNGQPTPSTS